MTRIFPSQLIGWENNNEFIEIWQNQILFAMALKRQTLLSRSMVVSLKICFQITSESTRRAMTLGGHSGRAHPSLAKLRDNILNGTIDFAEVPIADMNPEDIRAELKRVYTQLRMYKLKNLYQDNPHISKKRGGKKWSDKTGKVMHLMDSGNRTRIV
ncbi:unnamed protein product [Haemonchus placei]|uniref:Uncharacterized protein n=1 Tax=Haemonchus placei TaxID=6290 RepID=A0A3P7SM69_HAEPC|nr:unnamed protein product [Haemonchus placei]